MPEVFSAELAIRKSAAAAQGDKAALSDSTDLSIRSSVWALLDRAQYLWWYAAIAEYWVANQAISWWNMVSACKDFGSASNVVNCVWGAITTAITAAGVIYTTYVVMGKIGTWMNNNGVTVGGYQVNGWKRDDADEVLHGLGKIFNGTVTHAGVFNYTHLGLEGLLSERNLTVPLDVFALETDQGQSMHFSYLGPKMVNGKKKYPFKMGFGNGTVARKIKGRDEYFNKQWFSSGGIDFIIDQNEQDGGTLTAEYDYGRMNHEVSCYFGLQNGHQMGAAGNYF